MGRATGEIFCVRTLGRSVTYRDPEQRRRATGQPDGKADHPSPRIAGLEGVPHRLLGTGYHREGIPFVENRSPGDAAQRGDRSHAEGVSLHYIP